MNSNYNKEIIDSIYSLGRMFYYHGFTSEAEKVATGLLSIDENNHNSKLLLAAINFEKGNYSVASNYYRILSQVVDNKKINSYSLLGKLGLLACFIALEDKNRGESIAYEIEKNKENLGPLQIDFLELYSGVIKN